MRRNRLCLGSWSFFTRVRSGGFCICLNFDKIEKGKKGMSEHFDFNPSRMSRLFEWFLPRLVWEKGAEGLRGRRNYFKGRRGALMMLWTHFTSSRKPHLGWINNAASWSAELLWRADKQARESLLWLFFITGSSCARGQCWVRQIASQISIKVM